jgi:hypothetical protein
MNNIVNVGDLDLGVILEGRCRGSESDSGLGARQAREGKKSKEPGLTLDRMRWWPVADSWRWR